VSTGWTRGAYKPTLVSNTGFGSEPKGAATGTPAKAASNIASFGGSAAARKLEPVTALATSEILAFRRDYEERQKELAEEIADDAAVEATDTELFSDKAAAEAASAKADAKSLANERRARSIMQGYTGNMCSECQNFTMVRNGTCEKCDTCGATSGCS
jgi:ribonucleoside-diphosphate reductase alpha chain